MADTNRETGQSQEQGTAGGRTSPGVQESENAGMEQMSRTIREAREAGDPEVQRSEEDLHARQQTQQGGMQQGRMQGRTGSAEMGGSEEGAEDYDVVLITVREYVITERERGMCERERGMAERERGMFDRECAMTDRERSSAWGGGREEDSSTGGMTQGRSGMGGQPGSRQTGMNR